MIHRSFISRGAILFLLYTLSFTGSAQNKMAEITLIFSHVVSGQPLVLYDQSYENPFSETFTVNKFKYYLSHLSLGNVKRDTVAGAGIFLVDEKDPSSKKVRISVAPGTYHFLSFQVGVDSIYNVSGAQSGPLDPVKDMFWTWNTGYVMAKLEGNSPASKVVNGKFEYHIGGFAGKNNVLQTVRVPFPHNLQLKGGDAVAIRITADINKWFTGMEDYRISERPAINAPGIHAVQMSHNYSKMFFVEKIVSN